MFKVNNRNTRTRCKICSKLKIKTPEQRHWHRCGFVIVNSEYISHFVLGFLLLTLSMYITTGYKTLAGCNKTDIKTISESRKPL